MQQPPVYRWECTTCHKVKPPSEIKMCAGCKNMAYCSRECQKADWQTHKNHCNAQSRRDAVIKLAQKLHKDEEIMGWVDGILINALDLLNHPENASKYAIVLYVRANAQSKPANAPPSPRRRGMIPKSLHITEAVRLDNPDVPTGLNQSADRIARSIVSSSSSPVLVVRAMWKTIGSPFSFVYFARPIPIGLIADLHEKMKPTMRTGETLNTQWMIDFFNEQANVYDDIKKKLTIMVPAED